MGLKDSDNQNDSSRPEVNPLVEYFVDLLQGIIAAAGIAAMFFLP